MFLRPVKSCLLLKQTRSTKLYLQHFLRNLSTNHIYISRNLSITNRNIRTPMSTNNVNLWRNLSTNPENNLKFIPKISEPPWRAFSPLGSIAGKRCVSTDGQEKIQSSGIGDQKSSHVRAGILDRLFGESSNIATSGTNRWSMFVPAFLIHLCLGVGYGWSALSPALTREFGLVVSSAGDWSLAQVTYPMSIALASGGIAAAVAGRWQIKVGVRKSLLTGSLLIGLGYSMASAGIWHHNLPLLYIGKMVVGAGGGIAYTPPLQALIEWFPDKKGLASGVALSGFGCAALVFASSMSGLMNRFSHIPTYLGSHLDIITQNGRQLSRIEGGELQEVVYATTADLAKLPYQDMVEGFYLVGSGSSGAAASLLTMGGVYVAGIIAASLFIKRPPPGYLPEGYTPPVAATGSGSNVNLDNVMKTPQFWLLFATSTLLCTGGMGLMSVAKPMIQNVFTGSIPLLVTSSFASSYLMVMALGNLGGRLGWAAVSDRIGRRATFNIFTLGAIPLYASLPFFITQCVTDPTGPMAPYYLAAFCASTVTAISVMGGTFAVLPAYEADLYGPKYVGAIHGRFLMSATISAFVGPGLLLNLKKIAETNAINDLLGKVDPVAFLDKFGVGLPEAGTLIEAKTLTISNLMTIMPNGTIDPSPFLYNDTMYAMAGLVGAASLLHFMVKPVDKKYFEKP